MYDDLVDRIEREHERFLDEIRREFAKHEALWDQLDAQCRRLLGQIEVFQIATVIVIGTMVCVLAVRVIGSLILP